MPFPNLKSKHAHDAMFSPRDYLRYQKRRERYDRFKPPRGVIFCYSRGLLKYILRHYRVKKVDRFAGDMYLLKNTRNAIAVVANFGIGSPIVATLLEELIAFGVRRFISIGTAGSLQKRFCAGDVVVCEKAIRDEGTSHHYLKPSKYAYASSAMTERLCRALGVTGQKYVVGGSWTIDAPYRETVVEGRRYQKEGIATVEMEASALFAVAAYRNVNLGAAFVVSDSLAGLQWKPQFHHQKKLKGLIALFMASLIALQDL